MSEDIAWLAGFFEGEGNISANKTGRNTCGICFRLTQKNTEPLFKAKEIIDGLYGPVAHVYTYNSQRHISSLQVSFYPVVEGLLIAMWPWLSNKRHVQIQTEIDYFEEHCAKYREHDSELHYM